MVTFTVWSLDVWGHAPGECAAQYDCPCVKGCPDCNPDEDGEGNPDCETCEGVYKVHDDNRCQCDFNVNDRCRVGSLTFDGSDDAALLARLIEDGFIKPGITTGDVEFDDPSGMGEDVYVNDAKTGEPIFQLERDEV